MKKVYRPWRSRSGLVFGTILCLLSAQCDASRQGDALDGSSLVLLTPQEVCPRPAPEWVCGVSDRTVSRERTVVGN